MPWEYHVHSAILTGPNGEHYSGNGVYSGHPPYKDNPTAENVHHGGPIPHGWWSINLHPENRGGTGKFSLHLEPGGTTNTYGRTGFWIHGDERDHPGQGLGSTGCIVVPLAAREAIVKSGDSQLLVR